VSASAEPIDPPGERLALAPEEARRGALVPSGNHERVANGGSFDDVELVHAVKQLHDRPSDLLFPGQRGRRRGSRRTLLRLANEARE
jgi:hypothetical protein